MAQIFQHGGGVEQHQPVVIHRQDLEPARGSGPVRGIGLRVLGRSSSLIARQPDLRPGAFAGPALEHQSAAHLLGHAMHHGKAKPRAFAHALGGEERLGGPRQGFRIHAFAGVGDRQADIVCPRQGPVALSGPTISSRAEMPIVPPSGMASRALTERLRSASSSWFSSARIRGSEAGKTHLDFHVHAQ